MKKIILLSIIILCIFLLNKTFVFACQPIPNNYYKYLTLEQTISSSTNIVISERTQNRQASPEGFPVTSQYDWIEMNITQTLKGNLGVNNKIKIKTSDACGYGSNFSDGFGESGKKYLIFLGNKDGDDLWLPVAGSNYERGLRQYEIAKENIVGLNITVNNLKNKINNGDVNNVDSNYLIEGRTYTIKELNANTSATPRKFFTEAYIVYVDKLLPCPPGTEGICAPPAPPYIIISDENKRSSYTQSDTDASVRLGSYSVDSFNLGSKYRFETSISSSKQIDGTSRNEFILVSVSNLDGSDISTNTSTSPVSNNPPEKKSIFMRFLDWFISLF